MMGDDTKILRDISQEALRASVKHAGTDDMPDGTRDGGMNVVCCKQAKQSCDRAARGGYLTFAKVLEEEFYEAMCEEDPEKLREELVQVAAVCIRWIAKLDRTQKP